MIKFGIKFLFEDLATPKINICGQVASEKYVCIRVHLYQFILAKTATDPFRQAILSVDFFLRASGPTH